MLQHLVCPGESAVCCWEGVPLLVPGVSCVARVFSFLLDRLPHCKLGYWNLSYCWIVLFPLKLCQFLLHIFQCYDVKCMYLCYVFQMDSPFYHYAISPFISSNMFFVLNSVLPDTSYSSFAVGTVFLIISFSFFYFKPIYIFQFKVHLQ